MAVTGRAFSAVVMKKFADLCVSFVSFVVEKTWTKKIPNHWLGINYTR
jgi:hypothetical protein